MGFGRRAFLTGTGLGLAAPHHAWRERSSAQESTWKVVKRFVLEGQISTDSAVLSGTLTCFNDSGQSGGSLVESTAKMSPTTWASSGKGTRLPSGEFGGQVLGLNNNGLAVGREYLNVGGLVEPPTLEARQSWPAMWQDGEPVPFEFPGYAGRLNAVNDDAVIGGYYLAEFDYPYGFMWKDGMLTVLTSGFENLIPTHITPNGVIAGYKLSATESAGVLTYYDFPAIWIDEKVEYFTGVPSSLTAIAPEELSSFTLAGVTDDSAVLLSYQAESAGKGELFWWSAEGFKRVPDPAPESPMLHSAVVGPDGAFAAIAQNQDQTEAALYIWENRDSEAEPIQIEQLAGYDFIRLVALNGPGQILVEARIEGEFPEALILSND